MGDPCPHCGPGYHYGDDGCRHTPGAPGWADLWGIDPDYPRGDYDEAAVIRDLADRLDARAARLEPAAKSARQRAAIQGYEGRPEQDYAEIRRARHYERGAERLRTAAAVIREEADL